MVRNRRRKLGKVGLVWSSWREGQSGSTEPYSNTYKECKNCSGTGRGIPPKKGNRRFKLTAVLRRFIINVTIICQLKQKRIFLPYIYSVCQGHTQGERRLKWLQCCLSASIVRSVYGRELLNQMPLLLVLLHHLCLRHRCAEGFVRFLSIKMFN